MFDGLVLGVDPGVAKTGLALVGLGVSAIAAGALTRGIGLVFLDHFESTAMPLGAAEIEHG